jgi:hypothetical protein
MRVSNCLKYKDFYLIVTSFLLAAFTFPGPPASVNAKDCEEITVEVSGELSSNQATGSIKIDLKGMDGSKLIISVVGPKKFYLKDNKENEIKNLTRGIYSVVVVGREESYNYCPRHFTVDMK